MFLHASNAIYMNPPTPKEGFEDLWGLLVVVNSLISIVSGGLILLFIPQDEVAQVSEKFLLFGWRAET